uniref:Lens intrinsic membrane protein 2.3 n=1 Tax=Sinocyclocheilus anshuiensis TaxID=1608454 RepID=A0A671N1J9_9TELE
MEMTKKTPKPTACLLHISTTQHKHDKSKHYRECVMFMAPRGSPYLEQTGSALIVCPAAFRDATRAFMLLSVLGCFAGVLLGITLSSARFSVCCSGFYALVCGGFCSEAVCVSAGFLALLALAIYTGMTVNFFGKRYIDWRFSWLYILAWIGIILAFGAGTFHFIMIYFSHRIIGAA